MNDRSYRIRALLGMQQVDMWPWRVRRWLMRQAGLSIHDAAFCEAGVDIVGGRMDVARDVYVNRGCLFDARGGIAIGEGTLIGPRVSVLTVTHAVMPTRPRGGPTTYSGVSIGSGAWIGAGAMILPGSVVGDGCMVGAGAVVVGTLAADTLYLGVPATARKTYGG